MKEIIGVRFRPNGKIYFFSPGNHDVECGQFVIVETARGVEFGKVVLGKRNIDDGKIVSTLKTIIRVATDEDKKKNEDNKEKSKKAFVICKEKIAKHKLDMKLIEAEYTFDNNKVLFYFTADGRIDFRELVRIWHLYSRPGSSSGRSVSVMRPRWSAVSVSAAGSCVAISIFRNLFRYRSRWQRNRICP